MSCARFQEPCVQRKWILSDLKKPDKMGFAVKDNHVQTFVFSLSLCIFYVGNNGDLYDLSVIIPILPLFCGSLWV